MAYTDAQKRATNKWIKNHYDRINLTVDAGKKETWTQAAYDHGMDSLNKFIRYCVEKEIKNSGKE